MSDYTLGSIVYSFFTDYLAVQRGLQPSSIRSYRDSVRLLLLYVANERRSSITKLRLEDLTFPRVQAFLRHLEERRGNHIRTRNQRLAALHSFFEYVGRRVVEMLPTCEQVAAIPVKRVPPPEIRYLDRDEVAALLRDAPMKGRWAIRDHALLLFLYNTGARAQETASLRVQDLELSGSPRVRLLGKGGKWRTCPLWQETSRLLATLLQRAGTADTPAAPVFASFRQRPLSRLGIYRVVRRHADAVESSASPRVRGQRITPHVLRHTTAVHLLESGVEVNVIRSWLGHAQLATTSRYAEITLGMKEAALKVAAPAIEVADAANRKPAWRDDPALLKWLASL